MGWGDAIAGFSALAGYRGQQETNAANLEIARDQMAFQERMSSTAHQREVADLKAAGLNPILSVNAGASSPAGASATMQNPMQAIAANAGEFAKLHGALEQQEKQNKLLQAQTDNTNMDTLVKSQDRPKAELTNTIYDWFKNKLKESQQQSAKDHIQFPKDRKSGEIYRTNPQDIQNYQNYIP